MGINRIHTKEYYVASIDLLGMQSTIENDKDDVELNRIKNIYESWKEILKAPYFDDLRIRFFSDNVVVAIEEKIYETPDRFLEAVGLICCHLLKCKYKPRGGIHKGRFYIDDVLVWGSGFVDAYRLESRKAEYPRVVVSETVVRKASSRLQERMIFTDYDNEKCLNYLRTFGGSCVQRKREIESALEWLTSECNHYESTCDERGQKIHKKLQWLVRYLQDNNTSLTEN